jgi:FlaA1/EpsC-like NDP-sugar epimerase
VKIRIRRLIKITFFVLLDVASVYAAIFAGLLIRLEGNISPDYIRIASMHGIFIAAIFVLLFFALGLYRSLWEYAGSKQFLKLVVACILGTFITVFIELVLPARLPMSVIAVLFLTMLLLSGGIRISYRILRRMIKCKTNIFFAGGSSQKRVMIVGGGDAGSVIIREMLSKSGLNRLPVVVVDDDRNKHGRNIYGLRIEFGTKNIPDIAKQYNIYEIVFAIPSADTKNKNRILNICARTKCDLKVMPSLSELDSYDELKNLSSVVRKVKIEDLLGREQVYLDLKLLSNYISEKTILITGGGGSIGSEIARQIIKFHPGKIIILDIYENNAASLLDELKITYGREVEVDVEIASIRDIERLEYVFSFYKPYMVFHAAAHKHVPLMESNPCEAVKNNIFGTLNTAKMADKYNVKRFVLISTDKAVRPTSIMGASKRIAEMLVQSMNDISKTEFVSVRFGNVLDSNGSVIPLFKKQIESGGPVTITHPDVQRYFMTIPEAAQLVMQAGVMAKGGEIFVLDMGKPIKIMDLANKLINLSGFTPGEDIKLEIIGLRSGEKMFEEILLDEEGVDKTRHKKIFIGKLTGKSYDELMVHIESLKKCMHDRDSLCKTIAEMVPSYDYNKWKNQELFLEEKVI